MGRKACDQRYIKDEKLLHYPLLKISTPKKDFVHELSYLRPVFAKTNNNFTRGLATYKGSVGLSPLTLITYIAGY